MNQLAGEGVGDLEQRSQARPARPRRGQIRSEARQRLDEQASRASDREVADLREPERDGIGREGEGGGVEVAGRYDLPVLHEHEGVVTCAVELRLEGGFEQIERRSQAAVHLADAAERERVLQAPRSSRLEERATGKELTESGRTGGLAGCTPRGGHPRIDRGQVAPKALQRKRRGDLGGFEQLTRVVERERAASSGGRRRIDQREPVLRRERERVEPSARKRLACGKKNALAERCFPYVGLSLSDQRKPDVGEHAEITGADRPDSRHHRLDVRVQEVDQCLGNGRTRPRAAARHPVRAHEHRRPHRVRGQSGADRVRAAADRVQREIRQRLLRDSHPDARAEAGREPVGLASLHEIALDDGASRFDAHDRVRMERHRNPLAGHARDRTGRQPVAGQLERRLRFRGHASSVW